MKLKNLVSYMFDQVNKSMLVFIKGKQHSVTSDNVHFDHIAEQLKQGVTTEEEVEDLQITLTHISGLTDFRKLFKERFAVTPAGCMWEGKPIDSVLTDKIAHCYHNNLPYDNLVRFFENLVQNPYPAAREALSAYILRHDTFTITEDGCFIGYKAVYSDGTAIYNRGGKVYKYTIGELAFEDDFDPDEFASCSRGLHVGTYKFAENYGNQYGHEGETRLFYAKCNPAHVITVPSEGNQGKVRLSQLLPLGWMEETSSLKDDYVETKEIPGVQLPTLPLRDKFGRFLPKTGTASTAKKPKTTVKVKTSLKAEKPKELTVINRDAKGHFLPKSQWRYVN